MRLPPLPRLPLVPDPLRRIRLPRDLEPVTSIADEADPSQADLDAAVVERIWDAAVDLYRSAVHPALTLCVRRHGHVVLDRAIGHARGNGPEDGPEEPKVLATPETPFCVYSASKAFTALVVHALVDRGALSLEDRVADHLPGYRAHGKAETTIGHVLSHRAGVPTLPREVLDLERVTDREFILQALCDARPLAKPGTTLAYHALSGGFILAEVVRAATGRDIDEHLRKLILEPLGFRWTGYGVTSTDVRQVGLAYATGPQLLPPASTLVRRVLGAPMDRVVELSNDPRFLTAVLPSANIVTTANELSRFYEILRRGGELDGVRVMRPQTLRAALTEQSRLELDLSLIFPTRFSYGLMLGARWLSVFGRDTDLAFGHLGLINIMGWADPERGLTAGLITSGKALLYPEVARFYGVMQRIAAEVPKVAPSARPF